MNDNHQDEPRQDDYNQSEEDEATIDDLLIEEIAEAVNQEGPTNSAELVRIAREVGVTAYDNVSDERLLERLLAKRPDLAKEFLDLAEGPLAELGPDLIKLGRLILNEGHEDFTEWADEMRARWDSPDDNFSGQIEPFLDTIYIIAMEEDNEEMRKEVAQLEQEI